MEIIKFRLAIAVAVIALAPMSLPAQDAMPTVLSPYIDGQTVALARIDLSRLDLEAVFKQYVAIASDQPEVAAAKQMATAVLADLKKANVTVIYGLLSMADLPANPACLILPLAVEADGPKVIEALKKIEGVNTLAMEARGLAVIAAAPNVLTRLKAMTPAARADLAAALAAGKTAAISIAAAPSADLCRVAEETMPTLPKELGGGSIQLFSRSLTWAALSLETAPKLSATLTVQAADAAAAKKMDEVAKAFIKTAVRQMDGENEKAFAAFLTKILTPVVAGDRLTGRVEEEQFLKLFAESARVLRTAASRRTSTNNLKQIGLAMHSYLSDKGRFPADIVDKDGKPLLSWRVHLLPYLEQQNLYSQFKLDEPWDSAHNKPLIAKIPKIFVAPEQKSPAGTTTYLGPLGDGYLFRPKTKGEGLKINDITDGTSNTVMIVEAADAVAVEWTKPADWTPDVKEPLKALIGHYPEGTNMVFCDGSVRFFAKNWAENPKAFLAFLTVAGGEANPDRPEER